MALRPKGTQLPGRYSDSGYILTLAATVSDETVVWTNKTGATVKIISAGYIPDTAVTGADTNNMTLQFKSKTALGAAAANITAIKTYASGTDIAQFVLDNLVLSSTAADIEIDDGESVTLDKAENGTGLALPAGRAVLLYEFL